MLCAGRAVRRHQSGDQGIDPRADRAREPLARAHLRHRQPRDGAHAPAVSADHRDDGRPHRRRRHARRDRPPAGRHRWLSRQGWYMSTDATLAVENVRAGYQIGIDILQGVSLSVASGGLTLVIGPNGAGKSTLLKTIFGFLKAHAGTIHLGEHRIEGLEPYEVKTLGVGYVPQEINIFPLLTVEENLRMGGWTLRREPARLKAQLAKVYELFPVLADRRRSPAGDLSGGQGRMLSVAREMVAEPRLLLVDEPTAGLA